MVFESRLLLDQGHFCACMVGSFECVLVRDGRLGRLIMDDQFVLNIKPRKKSLGT